MQAPPNADAMQAGDGQSGQDPTCCPQLSRNVGPKLQRQLRPVERPFLIRPVELYEPSDVEAERRYHEEQSVELIDIIRRKLDLQKAALPGRSAEANATPTFEYMEGLLDGVIRTAPDIVEQLAGHIESKMCDAQTPEEELVGLSHMIRLAPELANPESFECLFTIHRGETEDAVLWFGLDAWKASRFSKTALIAGIEEAAVDPRTRRRFLSIEEELAMHEDQERRGEGLPTDPTGPMESAPRPRPDDLLLDD